MATIIGLRGRQLREVSQLSRRRVNDLIKVRQSILEERNQITAKRGVAQVRVDSVQSERDQALERIREPTTALECARLRLQEARSERERIGKELANSDGDQPQDGMVMNTQVQAAQRAMVLMREDIKQKRQARDGAQQRLAQAEVRVEAAKSSAASIDVAVLQQRLKEAHMKIGELRAPNPDDAQAQLRVASEAAGDLETTAKLARARLSDARLRFDGLVAAMEFPDDVLVEAAKERDDMEKGLQFLEESFSADVQAIENEVTDTQAAVNRLQEALTLAATQAAEVTQARDESQRRRQEARNRVDFLQQSLPSKTMGDAEVAFEHARTEFERYSGKSSFSKEDLVEGESCLARRQQELQRTVNEFQVARGQLELVGGTVVREQRDQESEALEGLRKSAEELELEFRATKRLLDSLKAAEAKHAAHLGRSLAKPITELLIDLAGQRYAQVVMDPSLRVQNITANGGEREWTALSVGTRDQLATLVRLALAAHLRSLVILDDQLAQSDQSRLEWFRNRLHASVREHKHQIIVITCRPLDYVRQEEIPGPSSCGRLETEAGLTVVDLEQVVSCFAE